MEEEIWKIIPEFPNYQISNKGRVYNLRFDHLMRTSYTPFGHMKITLKASGSNVRFTRSVAQLVAEAFVDRPNILCDQVMILDGDFSNVVAENLAWRPRWFVWKYTRQLKERQPIYYQNLPVCNVRTGTVYNSVVEAGITEGLLFRDIWVSTHTGNFVFPNASIFEVIK